MADPLRKKIVAWGERQSGADPAMTDIVAKIVTGLAQPEPATDHWPQFGEKVTTPEGKFVCKIGHGFVRYALISPSCFTDWQVPPPPWGSLITAVPYFKVDRDPDRDVLCIHLERGWVRLI